MALIFVLCVTVVSEVCHCIDVTNTDHLLCLCAPPSSLMCTLCDKVRLMPIVS